nr:MAG TPA: hypothetical protein [Caudoviricetes sp.]
MLENRVFGQAGGVFTYDMCWYTWICHWIYCS